MSSSPTIQSSLSTDHLARRRCELVASLEALQDELAEIDAKLVEIIGVGNAVETSTDRYAVVQAVNSKVDFDALVALRPTWARKVTKRVLDSAKFNLLRKANEVPADVLALVQEIPGKPYLRVTKR